MNKELIKNLLLLENELNKIKLDEDFTEEYYPYTILETIEILSGIKFETGEEFETFKNKYNETKEVGE